MNIFIKYTITDTEKSLETRKLISQFPSFLISLCFLVSFSFLISIFLVSPVYASTISSSPQIIATSTCSTGLSCGLVGYWTFDGKDTTWTSPTAATTKDKSGLGNTGTLTSMNQATALVIGKVGQALKFDAVGYVNLGNSSSLNPTDAMTITAWIYVTKFGLTGDTRLVDRNFSTAYFLGILTSGSPGPIEIYLNGVQRAKSTSNLALNKWQHIAFTYDKNAGSNQVKIYINGQVDGTGTYSTAIGTNTGSTMIGISQGLTEGFKGNMDDVRVYNRALSAAEVKQLYNMGSQKISSSVTTQTLATSTCATGLSCGLVGYWTFDGKDMSNGKVLDRSGLNNNGNLFNIATSTFYAAGKIGQGFKFDGVDDYVNVGKQTSLNDRGPLTYSVWINPRSLGGGSGNHRADILDKGNKTLYLSTVVSPAVPRLYISGQTSADATCLTQPIQFNKWMHVVFTWTGVLGTGNFGIYINGVSCAIGGQVGAGTVTSDSPYNMVVGALYDGSNNYFDGSLDDVRVYNRALSAAEVKQLYNMGAQKISSSVSTQTLATSTCSTGLSCGLVGYWTFDGAKTKNNIADSSGMNNTGYLNLGTSGNISTSSMLTIGKIGQAFKFDGVDDYVNASASNTLNLTSTLSVSVWIKAPYFSTGGYMPSVVSHMQSNPYNGYTLGLWTDGKEAAFHTGGTFDSSLRTIVGTTALNDNRWHHLIGVYDGTNSYIYVDGKLENSGARSNNLNISNQEFDIGANYNKAFFFPGRVDDVRVYNRALTAAEVRQLYNMGK